MVVNFLVVVAAYLLGAIPFGYLIVRFVEGKDIRAVGSGNIGATNVLRGSSKIAGVLTLLLDAGKGYLAVRLARWIVADPTRTWDVVAAVAAIAGHIFTVFLRFKGGKGVATGCGAYLAISPAAVVCTLLLFVITAAVSRYISLASIVATAAYPLWAYLFGQPKNIIVGGIIGASLIIIRHNANIRRLFQGRENKVVFLGKST